MNVKSLIWEDAEGQLAGFNSRYDHGYFELLVTPERVGSVEFQQMVRDLESQPILPLDDPEIVAGSRTMVREDDVKTRAYLKHDGYRITEITKVHMLRAIDSLVDPADVLVDFSIRSLAGEAEITARLKVHTAVFGGEITDERCRSYKKLKALPTYRRDLDLVAVAADGTFAASCLFWLDEPNGLAQIEPIGTVPEHRKKGLAKALIQEGARRLDAIGATTIYVRPEDAEPGLIRFYEKCGFRVTRRDNMYFKARQL